MYYTCYSSITSSLDNMLNICIFYCCSALCLQLFKVQPLQNILLLLCIVRSGPVRPDPKELKIGSPRSRRGESIYIRSGNCRSTWNIIIDWSKTNRKRNTWSKWPHRHSGRWSTYSSHQTLKNPPSSLSFPQFSCCPVSPPRPPGSAGPSLEILAQSRLHPLQQTTEVSLTPASLAVLELQALWATTKVTSIH